MFKLQIKIYLILITTLFSVAQGFAQQEAAKAPDKIEPDTEISREVSRKAILGREQIINQAIATAQQLISKPKEEQTIPDAGRMKTAIALLGHYRAKEAVNFLVTNVSARLIFAVMMDNDFLVGYPSARALIQIGDPTIEAIFRRLSFPQHLVDPNPLNPRDFHLFAYIIREIDGHDVGFFRLELALKSAETETQKQNFADLIEIYKKQERPFEVKLALLANEIKAETQTVDFLLDKISVEVPSRNFWNDNFLQNYPSIQSLVELKGAALEGISSRLEKSVTKNDLRAYAIVIQSIDGGIHASRFAETLRRPLLTELHKANLIQLQNFLKEKQTDIDFWKAMHPDRDKLNAALRKIVQDAEDEELKQQPIPPALN